MRREGGEATVVTARGGKAVSGAARAGETAVAAEAIEAREVVNATKKAEIAKAGEATIAGGVSDPQLLPKLKIGKKQFGEKWKKHAKHYGALPGDAAARTRYRQLIEDVKSGYEEIRQGPWNPNGNGGPDYLFFRKGNDLLVMKPSGDFVTLFPLDAEGNSWFSGASIIFIK